MDNFSFLWQRERHSAKRRDEYADKWTFGIWPGFTYIQLHYSTIVHSILKRLYIYCIGRGQCFLCRLIWLQCLPPPLLSYNTGYILLFLSLCLSSLCAEPAYTDKKEVKFSSYMRKFRMEQLQSHIWLTASSYMVKYLCISSYIWKALPHIWLWNCSILNFCIYEENFIVSFISVFWPLSI